MAYTEYYSDSEGYLRGLANRAQKARQALIGEAREFWLETSPIVTAEDKAEYAAEVAYINSIGHVGQINLAKAHGLRY
jgi:hypothetical protein